MTNFTAYVEYDEETEPYVGTVPAAPGAHSRGANLEELRQNLARVLQLCLEEQDEPRTPSSRFIGVEQIEVA